MQRPADAVRTQPHAHDGIVSQVFDFTAGKNALQDGLRRGMRLSIRQP